MRAIVLACVLGACGRLGFEPVPAVAASDADGPDTPPPGDAAPAAFVQGTALPLSSGTSEKVTIAPTAAGDLLVVGVTQESGTSATVASIADDVNNTYVSASVRSVDTNCANTTEIWYAAVVHPGATLVTVTMSASVTIEVWVLEFSGPGATPLTSRAATSSRPSAQMISAPIVTTSVPNEVVISTAATCGAISKLVASSPFTALAIEDGEDTAYYVAPAPGSYGANWSYSGGSWDASSAAFR